MRLSSARRDGLSLLEVLVSLAIFLTSLVALTALVNTSSNLAAEGQRRARAAQLARSKMNDFACGAAALESQPDASFEDETDFRWSADVAQGATAGLFNVTLTVTYKPDDPYPVKVVFSRMILDPKVTGSTQDVPAQPDDSAADPAASSGSSGSGSGSSASGGAAASSGAAASKSGGASAGTAAKSSGGAGAGTGAAAAGGARSGTGAGATGGGKGK